MNPDHSAPLVKLPKLDLSRLVLALRHSNPEARKQVGTILDVEG